MNKMFESLIEKPEVPSHEQNHNSIFVTHMKDRLCEIEGCHRKARNKGSYKGSVRYDRVCAFHHKKKGKEPVPYFVDKKKLPNKKCERCGWDEGPCDRHRIIPELGYTKENVKILCPNCHRLVTLKLIDF